MSYSDDTSTGATLKGPCTKCGSSDGCVTYPDGHTHCFVCQHHTSVTNSMSQHETSTKETKSFTPLIGEAVALGKRGIAEDTCKLFDYRVTKHKGKTVQVATYRDAEGTVVGQKLRFPDKSFTVLGNVQDYLYGQNHCRDGGKKLVVTEGEIDCLTVSQVQGNKWPVVSIPNGASAAVRAVRKNIDFLDKFESVIFMFDMDAPGQEAAKECAALLKPGRAKIAHLPLKDPNEMLQAGQGNKIIDCIWGAKAWRPDGVVGVQEVAAQAKEPVKVGSDFPWKTLTEWTYGRRSKELIALGGGVGSGKTDVLTTIIAHCINDLKESVGVIYLEQPPVETVRRIAGKIAGKTFHIPNGSWKQEDLDKTIEGMGNRLYLYDHFGSSDWENIRSLIRYMAISLGVKTVVLDHLTALAAHAEDERRELDAIMADLGGDVQELDITILFVSHLTTPEGVSHEEGGKVSAKQFTGSRAIMRWASFMFGIERNQQAPDIKERHTTTIRCLKDRLTGQAAGEIFQLEYDASTGRLSEVKKVENFEPEPAAATTTTDQKDF